MRIFSQGRVLSRLLTVVMLSPVMAMVAAPARVVAQSAAGQDSAQTESRSDALVESDVLGALNSSSVLKAQQITAATIEGDVTLSGNVSDAASKELAGMLVSRVNGVRSVNNNLTVGAQAAVDPATQSSAQPTATYGEQLPPAQDNSQPDMEQQNVQDPGAPMDAPPAVTQGSPNAPRAPLPPRSPSSPYPPSGSNQPASSGPVQIPQGTLLKVRLSELLDARHAQQGTMFEATAASDVYSGGVLAIPRGAVLEGQVVDVKSAKGGLGGSSALTLKLNSLMLGGKSYSLDTDVWSSNGPGKAGYSANNTVAGAAVGAIIGGIAGGGTGAAIGAAAGGATGVAASAATSGPRLVLPPEQVLTFHLANAVTVIPVSYQEAQRLATASQQGGRPGLQHRPAYPGYGYPGYPPPPVAYGYPYPYYYPYYRGGYYYGAYFGR